MERMARLLTKQFIQKLPDDKDFYTPQDLYDLNFPDFLVERVVMEMNINLSDSIVPPHSEWADMAAESVQNAWQQFLDAIAEEHRMPASFAGSVFETAVADTLEMCLQPREAIPYAIFGRDENLPINEIRERVYNVTLHKHLAFAVVRYMERKDKHELSFEKCKQLVEHIDEKLVRNYNPLNWAQVLEPLFQLVGATVDTNLFRIFFEDKGRARIARKFDLMDTTLDRSGLIEMLSVPDITDGDDTSQAALFEEKPDTPESLPLKEQVTSEDDEDVPETISPESSDVTLKIITNREEEVDEEEYEDSLLSSFTAKAESGEEAFTEIVEEPEEDEGVEDANHHDDTDDTPLYSRFKFDTAASKEKEPDGDAYTGETTLYKEMNLKQDSKYSDREITIPYELKSEETTPAWQGADVTDLQESEEQEEEFSELEEKEKPIWKAFLAGQSGDDMDQDKLNDGGLSEASVINLAAGDPSAEKKIEALSGWLEDDEERFVSGIFGGSESAYEQALETIYDFDDWKNASRYIQKDIFARNRVDVFDEVAVDFTDRLHTFFQEFKSPKING